MKRIILLAAVLIMAIAALVVTFLWYFDYFCDAHPNMIWTATVS